MKNTVYEADVQTGEVTKEQIVHICLPQNVGTHMCIDEKMIDKKYATIVSNQETGKIALLIHSMKPIFVKQAISCLGKENLEKIKIINADMSPTMHKLCTQTMHNAERVIDKFHVIKHIMDALNNVRLTVKYDLKSVSKEKDIESNNPNQWTDIEMLEKVRYLLYKMKDELNSEEKELLDSVISKYSSLEIAYNMTQEIREWYHKSNIGKPQGRLLYSIREWTKKVKESKIKSFESVAKMIEKHEQDILRYFISGQTNAKAENLNSRIQRLLASNYGTRDRDFFFYRTQIYFALAPQKKN